MVLFAPLVFLGGSCNPTTWRHDVAIPYLKRLCITFYNPVSSTSSVHLHLLTSEYLQQVGNWKPELMEIEDQAKMTAELLFFVIDNQTRSTASMVEAAYLAGCGRQLVLVIKDFVPPVVVAGEQLSSLEVEDLERSHAYLTDLVERQGIPVFNDIDTALDCTGKAISQSVKVSDLTLSDGAMPVKFAHIRVADKLMKLRDVFNSVDTNNSGRLSKQDIRLALRTIMDEDASFDTFQTQERDMFTFEEFCCMVAEMRCRRQPFMQRLLLKLSRLPMKIFNWIHGYQVPSPSNSELRQRDLFLGGSCGFTTWREDIAIPMLKKEGMSFFNPQLPEWSMRYIPLEAAVKDSCCLLLYVITPDTRGITSMLEASHFIGQGCQVVLCIQPMQYGVQIEGECLTELAVKDYNRARAYLSDLANRDGVPVFDKIEEAVQNSIHRLRDQHS
ncbi:hypothetical protein CAPTEDRAFT_221758 [Capitella teleta]|uniref:EF-hand domain-containing protein n=1 Tax=Capitella teleta TaxID=283909 RepID=R7UJR1_CAPTE|nr:hypothetical protein CAPTEDRAFT_221758 [Capitella teleta]|eukprot:ELU06794.1 hypothetical protein CAPTEDRAFT_221758 [Capitella teleta]